MINKHVNIDHKRFESFYHEMIKHDLVDTQGQPSPRAIISTVIPDSWKPPVEVIERTQHYIEQSYIPFYKS